MKHKHYDLIVQWASDPEAYNVQCRWSSDGDWRPCDAPMWEAKVEYRLIPKRKMWHLNGVEFPAPETEAPKQGAVYWYPTPTSSWSLAAWSIWKGEGEKSLLRNGLVHLTEEAAEAHARAMLAAKEVE